MTVHDTFPTLKSNGHTLDTSAHRMGRLVASDPGTSIETLREQFAARGYLWLKGLLPREGVMRFRERFFSAFAPAGLLKPGTSPREGIYSGSNEDNQRIAKTMHEVVRWSAYESFCLQEPIWMFYERLFDGAPYLHKRKLIRYTKPQEVSSTGAHYDLVYLRAGTDRVATSWIPIGDCPIEMGGLVYLEGSHVAGRQMEKEFSALNADLSREDQISAYNKSMSATGWLTKDLPALAEKWDLRWLVADYEAGDMVIHSAYMIHAATGNDVHDGTMRLSTDIRFQRVSDEVDARWNSHYSMDDML